jgi:hypothetical protein
VHEVGTAQSVGAARQVSSAHLKGVRAGQLTGVLHVAGSVTQLPSGQAIVPSKGGRGGRGGHAATVLAQEESKQRTGALAGQMNDSGHRSGLATHTELVDAMGHE